MLDVSSEVDEPRGMMRWRVVHVMRDWQRSARHYTQRNCTIQNCQNRTCHILPYCGYSSSKMSFSRRCCGRLSMRPI